jgi:hypothetical protein
MSSNRTIYDNGATDTYLKQSTNQLNHTMDIVRQESCQVCSDDNKKHVMPLGELADIESELRGLPRALSKDPNEKYQKSNAITNTNKHSVPWTEERQLHQCMNNKN